MSFLSYTIFADAGCTKVRGVANLSGNHADKILRAFHEMNGGSVSEGQLICGCRIDRIGSEDISEAA